MCLWQIIDHNKGIPSVCEAHGLETHIVADEEGRPDSAMFHSLRYGALRS